MAEQRAPDDSLPGAGTEQLLGLSLPGAALLGLAAWALPDATRRRRERDRPFNARHRPSVV